ncbi:MAG: helix-turn-helix transcriptional regulator [Caldilineaceae bacterium]|nr:helix-turn-helix transcriptional regulator [Caldilineaceae bacterium]
MSIKHSLLALLAEEPGYGYELKNRFDQVLGEIWPLQQAQIYNNLRILEKDGLIELDALVAQDDLPDRKEYRLTAAGQQELATWISSPASGSRKLRDDLYLKMMTIVNVLHQPQKLSDLLWQQRDIYLHQLRDLERSLAQAEAVPDLLTAGLLEGAILHTEADLTWLDRMEERLQALTQAGAA